MEHIYNQYENLIHQKVFFKKHSLKLPSGLNKAQIRS